MTFPTLLAVLLAATAPEGAMKVTVSPDPVMLVRGSVQELNFDFVIENQLDEEMKLNRIELTVSEKNGVVVSRKFLSTNGFSPGILTVFPDRTIAPKSRGLIFNPFHQLPVGVVSPVLAYEFVFDGAVSKRSVTTSVKVVPLEFKPATALSLPLPGRILVDDGADFYGHHRRLHTTHPVAVQLGFVRNFMRHAVDLLEVNASGDRHSGDGNKNDDWFSWGDPALAPAPGRIVDVYEAQPDNDTPGRENKFKEEDVFANPMRLYGNYVVIDHGKGEYSLLAHLMEGSVVVEKGQNVKLGDVVGKVGSSGSSIYPHLHYELRTGPTIDADGLPLIFNNFRRAGSKKSTSGEIATGQIVQR